MEAIGSAKSPVQGEAWPALDAQYKKAKTKAGGSGKADLELEGDLLDSFKAKDTPTGAKFGHFGDQAPKADGHNKLSGKTNDTPQRRYLPAEEQKYKVPTTREVERIVADAIAEDISIKKSDFKDIKTRAGLIRELRLNVFPSLPGDTEVGNAALRNNKVRSVLASLDLLRFL